VLAAFTIPVVGSLKKQQYINHTRSELELIATAIDRYKADYGFYPPSAANAVTNQLYYELEGTTFGGGTYTNLDGGASINTNNLSAYFSVSGILNCTQSTGEDSKKAKSYLSDLKPGQIASNGVVTVLVGSVSGLDPSYQPMSGFTSGSGNNANPFRYNSANPTNNPNSYDLWIQLQLSGKKYLICNWSKQVQINSPLP